MTSIFDLCEKYTTRYDEESIQRAGTLERPPQDRIPLLQLLHANEQAIRLVATAVPEARHGFSNHKPAKPIYGDFKLQIRELEDRWLSSFASLNQCPAPLAWNLNDVCFHQLCRMTYFQDARRHHLVEEQKVAAAADSDRPVSTYYDWKRVVDSCARISALACTRHMHMMAEKAADFQQHPLPFPSKEEAYKLMGDLCFLLAWYYYRQDPISEDEARRSGVTTRLHIKTTIHQHLDDLTRVAADSEAGPTRVNPRLVVPEKYRPSAQWLAIRLEQSGEAKDIRQGALWKADVESCVDRLVPWAGHVVAQILGEHRLLEKRWPSAPVELQRQVKPIAPDLRANVRRYLRDWLLTDPPSSFMDNYRIYCLEHLLPIASRTYHTRERVGGSTKTKPDVLMNMHLGATCIKQLVGWLQNVEGVRTVADSPTHPLYPWVFLSVFDFDLFQCRNIRWCRDHFISPGALLGPLAEGRLQESMEHNQKRRPVVSCVAGHWRVHYDGAWWNGGGDLVDAILIYLQILTLHCRAQLADGTSLASWAKRLLK